MVKKLGELDPRLHVSRERFFLKKEKKKSVADEYFILLGAQVNKQKTPW